VSVTKVVLAKLSPTMEEGTIVKWSKREGDPVKVGDVLAEIETDKANMEMEALGTGVLRKILIPAGGKAPVGALIGVVADPGDDISALLASAQAPAAAPAAQPTAPAAQPTAPPAAQPAASVASSATPAAPAPAPPAVAQAAPATQEPSPTPFRAPAAPPASGADGRVKASPLARNMAAERNIPLAAVPGSGPGGRVIKRDIESWSPAQRTAAPSATPSSPGAAPPAIVPGQAIPVSSMRKAIAKRLSESKFTAPHYYVSMDVDMDAAVAMREQLVRAENTKLSYNDFVVKACAKALTRWPMVNASWAGETIATHAEVHVGVAVALTDGLITPVVRNADRKSLAGISHEIKALAARAKEKKLRPEEFSGSTFTVSNLGMYDVTEFTAIINPPESCILAVGTVRRLPVVAGETIRVGHRMRLTLSSDHRVVDGATAAQFLQDVRRLLENPIGLLL